MGGQPSKPVTTKHSQDGDDGNVGRCFGLSSCQGWRPTMEDAHVAILDLDGRKASLFGVFDGHGGKSVAQFCRRSIREELLKSQDFAQGQIKLALERAFMSTDEKLIQADSRRNSGEIPKRFSVASAISAENTAAASSSSENNGAKISIDDDDDDVNLHDKSSNSSSNSENQPEDGEEADEDDRDDEISPRFCGSTAVVAVVVDNVLYVSNAGDSRAVVCKNGRAMPMSCDHKPGNASEMERIHHAGGSTWAGRVNGRLAVSRAIGDLQFKQNKELPAEQQMVSAFPEVRLLELDDCCDFIILACDGVWDVMSNQDAVDFVAKRIGTGQSLSKIVEEMMDTCIAPALDSDNATNAKGLGYDNMTAIIVTLNDRCYQMCLNPSTNSLKDISPSTIYDGAVADDVKIIEAALAFGDCIEGPSDERETPLHRASAHGCVKAVNLLIELRANVVALDSDQCTPLHRAAAKGHLDVCKVLCENGGGIEKMGQYGRNTGWTPMHFAANNGHVHIIEHLIFAKADLHGSVNSQRTPFSVACMSGHDNVVKLLLDRNASVEGGNDAEHTPLCTAASAGHLSVVATLLGSNANPNPRPRETTALHVAAEKGFLPIADLLLERGAHVDAIDESQSTALMLSCQVGNVEMISLLLKHGAAVTPAVLGTVDTIIEDDNRAKISEILSLHM